MPFNDWAEIEGADPVRLPIKGKIYTLPAIGHLDALRLRADQDRIRKGQGSDIPNEEVLRRCLGASLDEMRADNVPDKAILLAATVNPVDTFAGRVAAEQLWEHGQDPKALAEGIKQALASLTTLPATPPQTPTSSTRKRASTASTRSPRARRSTGTKSSTSRG